MRLWIYYLSIYLIYLKHDGHGGEGHEALDPVADQLDREQEGQSLVRLPEHGRISREEKVHKVFHNPCPISCYNQNTVCSLNIVFFSSNFKIFLNGMTEPEPRIYFEIEKNHNI